VRGVLPALAGQNLVLRDTVEDLFYTSDQTFYETKVMPLFQTDQVNLQWEEFVANAHFLELNPYLTPAHLVTQKRMIRRAALVRRGISAEFEADFLRTPLGRVSYLAAFRQITRSFMETQHLECLRELQNSHRHQQQWQRDHGPLTSNSLAAYLEEDKRRFAIAQKTKNGLAKLDMMINRDMQAKQGYADMYLLPEDISIYATIVRPEVTDYDIAGPMGPARVNGLPLGRVGAIGNSQGSLERVEPTHMVHNVPAYIVRHTMADGTAAGIEPLLARVRQIGEYMTMIDDTVDYSNYHSEHRSIEVYSEEDDEMVRVGLREAIENCGAFEQASPGRVLPLQYYTRGDSTINMDLDQDFLTRFTGNGTTDRRPVEYIYDLAVQHLSKRKLVGAGESMYGSIVKQYGQAGVAALSWMTQFRAAVVSNQATAPTFETLDDAVFNRFGPDPVSGVSTTRKGMVTFLSTVISEVAPGSTAARNPETFFQQLVRGRVAVATDKNREHTYTEDAPPPASRPPQRVNQRVDDAMLQLLRTSVAQVPKEHTETANKIVNGSGTPLEKAESLRNHIIDIVQSGIQVAKMKDVASVHEWHDKIVSKYQARLASDAREADESAARSKPVETQEIAGYMHPGRNLAGTGYRYIDPSHATKSASKVGSNFFAEIGAETRFSTREDVRKEHDSRRTYAGMGERTLNYNLHLAELSTTGAPEVIKFLASVYLSCEFTRDTMLAFEDRNVMVPMNFLLLRPHMQYLTRTIIKCAANGKTGITAYGNSNMQVAHGK
jgi:hypothetical protein